MAGKTPPLVLVRSSLEGGNSNTAVGSLAGNDITGNLNTCLGHSAGSNLIDGEGNIYIGAEVQPGATDELEFIRIGDDTAFAFPYDTFIAGIFDRDVDAGTFAFVLVDDTGKLGTNAVDAKETRWLYLLPKLRSTTSSTRKRESRNWKIRLRVSRERSKSRPRKSKK